MNWQKRGWFALALLALMGCGEEESVEVIELPQDLDAMISIADAAVDPPDAVILPADAQVMRDGGPAPSRGRNMYIYMYCRQEKTTTTSKRDVTASAIIIQSKSRAIQ